MDYPIYRGRLYATLDPNNPFDVTKSLVVPTLLMALRII